MLIQTINRIISFTPSLRFSKPSWANLFLGCVAVSKELRKELETRAKEFKFEPELTKKKARELYKVSLKALDLADKLKAELDAYKQPKLYDKAEVNKIPERIYYSREERIQQYLDTDPDGDAFKHFLKWNNLTIDQAKELVYNAKKVK
jgi:ssDNA-specific exonuclease RecJ